VSGGLFCARHEKKKSPKKKKSAKKKKKNLFYSCVLIEKEGKWMEIRCALEGRHITIKIRALKRSVRGFVLFCFSLWRGDVLIDFLLNKLTFLLFNFLFLPLLLQPQSPPLATEECQYWEDQAD
jgi:hypothetical protein